MMVHRRLGFLYKCSWATICEIAKHYCIYLSPLALTSKTPSVLHRFQKSECSLTHSSSLNIGSRTHQPPCAQTLNATYLAAPCLSRRQILPNDLLSSFLAPGFTHHKRLAILLTVSLRYFSPSNLVYLEYIQADDVDGSKRRPSA